MAAERFFEDAQHAEIYAKFRPRPPDQLTERVVTYLKEKYDGPLDLCVDVGCGSGQSSATFTHYFDLILATDVSVAQIQVAQSLDHPANIEFQNSPAEQIPLSDRTAALVNASTAAHWFDLPAFYKEVDRVLRSNGVIALSCYGVASHVFVHPKSSELGQAFDTLYREELGSYWGVGNRHVYNEYADIKIPYDIKIREELWTEEESVTLSQVASLLETAGPYQNYCRSHGKEAGQKLLDQFVSRCLDVLQMVDEPSRVQLKWKRKYLLMMGRKP